MCLPDVRRVGTHVAVIVYYFKRLENRIFRTQAQNAAKNSVRFGSWEKGLIYCVDGFLFRLFRLKGISEMVYVVDFRFFSLVRRFSLSHSHDDGSAANAAMK